MSDLSGLDAWLEGGVNPGYDVETDRVAQEQEVADEDDFARLTDEMAGYAKRHSLGAVGRAYAFVVEQWEREQEQ